MYRYLGLFFSLVALGVFVPGIVLPMFNLNMDMMINVTGTHFDTALVSQELSILGTVEKLWTDKRYLVAALIFIFSVVIPLLKSAAVALGAFSSNSRVQKTALGIVNTIGKWSMADVFVVAIFLAVLSTQHSETANSQTFSIFGFKLDVLISTQTLSSVGAGFYYFLGYCIASLFGSQLISYHKNSKPVKEK